MPKCFPSKLQTLLFNLSNNSKRYLKLCFSGKGHNHDCCDACGEGGDLLCCDFCPASFHFSCHCPPLEEEEIPMVKNMIKTKFIKENMISNFWIFQGDWSCLSCYYKEKTRTLTSEKVKSSVFPTHTETKEIATEILVSFWFD